VLDGPTNDLDIDTLELLEDLLQNYAGTVFLVSHDRAFLDNVVTSTIVFEGDGSWREYEGGVQDWLTQSRRALSLAQSAAPADSRITPAEAKEVAPAVAPPAPRKKLSYKEQRELDALPALIEALEAEQKQIHDELADGALYGSDPARAARLSERSSKIDDELTEALERWESLTQTT
jgi:ABC transport system ATP-binding/permease protein